MWVAAWRIDSDDVPVGIGDGGVRLDMFLFTRWMGRRCRRRPRVRITTNQACDEPRHRGGDPVADMLLIEPKLTRLEQVRRPMLKPNGFLLQV